MRDRIQDAIENGQRNQHVLQMLYNWCGHVRTRKQGVGLVEQMTGLPIGHMSLECPHAPAGGMSAFELSDTVLDFHDRNCVDCKFRKPMGFPNISELLAERERRNSAQRLEQERLQAEQATRLAAREAARQKLRSSLDAISTTTLDRIVELDRQQEGAAQRLIETAKLAPETFTPEITDHLFDLIDSQEYGLVGPSLEAVSHLPVDSARLCNVALRALRSFGHAELGGAIVEKNCANADPGLIADALPAIASLANPPSLHFGLGQRREPVTGPLKALYAHHKDAVRAGLRQILENKRPYIARLAALGLEALIPVDGTLTSFLVPELIAKLARANRLLEGREDEVEDTLNDIRTVLVLAFKADPAKVDQLIKDFLLGASDEGAAELYKIYDDVLHGARFNDDKAPITPAHEVAFRRLVVAASEATSYEVQQATSGFFHGEPYDMAPVAAKQIDLLLGSAAVLDSKLTALKDAPLDKKNEAAGIERESRLQYLDHLSDSFVRWACLSAARAELLAITSVLKFLRALPEGSDRLVAKIIGKFHAMMRTPEGLIACLPDFYSAQVGSSQVVRSYSATAMGQMRGATHDDLPSLAFEAFCAQLSDPFLIVHKAAFRALERFTLPKGFLERAKREMTQLIVYYAKERPKDGFLVEVIDLYIRRFAKDDPQADAWMALFVEILKKAEPYTVAKAMKYGRKLYTSAPGYPALLFQLIEDRQAMSLFGKELMERFADLPPRVVLQEREALLALGKKLMANNRELVGVLIEAFSAAGLWDDGLELSKAAYDGIEDNVRNTPLRLHSALRMIACDFEAAVYQNDGTRIEKLSKEFHAALTAIEEDHAANSVRRDPLRGLSGTH
jgi:hypothetical protein